tara:strand:- start:15166 stop:16029 length:864 start_codon:yes stop_codon:yes gene_type:complete
MVAIFDSPDYLITSNHVKNIGFFKKLYYFIVGVLVGYIHRYFHGSLFTVLINVLLRKKVKLKYEKPFYVGVEGELKFYFPNKRVTRLLMGIEKQADDIFNLYLLDKIEFDSGDTIIDCGANVGELHQSLKNNIDCFNYIGFEPDPVVYKCLQKNITSKNSQLYHQALSNKSSVESLYISTEGADTSLVFLENKESIEVQTVPLDEFNLSGVKLIKMDAEGFELEVLQGSKNTLKSTEYVSVDFGPEKGTEGKNTIPEVSNFLYENNFKMIHANTDRHIGLFKNQLFN